MAERAVPLAWLPQRAPARMVDAIVETTAEGVVCRGGVPPASAFASADGRVPALVLLELAAQAAAVHEASASGAVARRGYVVGIRSAVLHADDVPAGASFLASASRIGQAGPLATYDVAVRAEGGEAILAATLSLHRGD
jgi:predicted hotdog family 3-hydroxylacyl-ACP dehydratase